jgi:hypothetical protein
MTVARARAHRTVIGGDKMVEVSKAIATPEPALSRRLRVPVIRW